MGTITPFGIHRYWTQYSLIKNSTSGYPTQFQVRYYAESNLNPVNSLYSTNLATAQAIIDSIRIH